MVFRANVEPITGDDACLVLDPVGGAVGFAYTDREKRGQIYLFRSSTAPKINLSPFSVYARQRFIRLGSGEDGALAT